MNPGTARELSVLLIQSGLVSRKRFEGWVTDRRTQLNGHASDFADTLVAAGFITRWQADKLLAGKWKGFYLDGYVITDFVQVDEEKNVSCFAATDVQSGTPVTLEVAPPSSGRRSDGAPYYMVRHP